MGADGQIALTEGEEGHIFQEDKPVLYYQIDEGPIEQIPASFSIRPPNPEYFFQAEDGIRGGTVTGVQTCALPILAAGAWSRQLQASGTPPVRPVKGQIMRLRDPAGPGLVTRVLRYEGGYIVPRGDGRYVLGATVEESGLDLAATAGGVYELLREARELVPGVLELEIEEVSTGLRPGSPDNRPFIGS